MRPLLGIALLPGNAGVHTATDHLDVLAGAIARLPAAYRRHLLIRVLQPSPDRPTANAVVGYISEQPWPCLTRPTTAFVRWSGALDHGEPKSESRSGQQTRSTLELSVIFMISPIVERIWSIGCKSISEVSMAIGGGPWG
ncbi:hypothetical protein ACIG87_24405 [Micromonospora sp. NPDC051925]|uniref:hypothetical protein n=1 Tax=Micromonospora sp. NPDC051925 TaxID=3364288 RepID=UPI0037C9A977